jgi:hypothetical protein
MINNRIFFQFLCMLILLCVLSACGGAPVEPTATVTTGVLDTQLAQTTIAGKTLTVAAYSPTPVPPTRTPRSTNTPLPSVTPAPTGRPTSSILGGDQTYFRDDFESLAGWYTGKTDKYTIEFSGGGYRMYVNLITGDWPVYSVREYELEDIKVAVDVIQQEGPDNSFFGLVCRFTDLNNYYRFVLYTDGYYEIGKMVNGKYKALDKNTEVNVLAAGGKTNHIQANCVGSILSMSVNDKEVSEVLDRDLVSGYVGLVVGTYEKTGIDVLFDNFILEEP